MRLPLVFIILSQQKNTNCQSCAFGKGFQNGGGKYWNHLLAYTLSVTTSAMQTMARVIAKPSTKIMVSLIALFLLLCDYQTAVGGGFGVLVEQIGMGQLKGCAVEAVGGDGFPCDHAIPSG